MLLSMASAEQKPKRLLLLFPGYPGIMKLHIKDGRAWFSLLGNYLLRSRALFVDAEAAAVSVDALSHLGITHLDIPITPEKVWRALKAKGAAA